MLFQFLYFQFIKNFPIFFIFSFCGVFLFCGSRQLRLPSESASFNDNTWLTEDVLQVYVEARGSRELIPEVLKREQSCQEALQGFDSKMDSLYKNWKSVELNKKKFATIYYSGGGCRIYFRLIAIDLKKKLRQ